MRDDLSGHISTEANTPPATRSDADRAAEKLVTAYNTMPGEQAQQVLDNKNAMSDAHDAVAKGEDYAGDTGDDAPPLPPMADPMHVEPEAVKAVRLNLSYVDGGPELIERWGTDFGSNLGHALAGLEQIRADNPELSRVLDSLPLEVQNRIAIAGGLEFAARYNRAYRNFNEPQWQPPSSGGGRGRGPSPSPPPYRGGPRMKPNDAASAEADRLTGQAMDLRRVGNTVEANELIRRAQALRERDPGGNEPIVGRFGRTI